MIFIVSLSSVKSLYILHIHNQNVKRLNLNQHNATNTWKILVVETGLKRMMSA